MPEPPANAPSPDDFPGDENDEPRVTDEERMLFDTVLEAVLAELPPDVLALLEEIPLVVEDYPGDEVLEELDIEIEDAGDLCGLHTGIPLTERSSFDSGVLGDVIHIYRDGILNLVVETTNDTVHPEPLRQQIRITLLHEIGHHFGLDEDDLQRLGYE